MSRLVPDEHPAVRVARARELNGLDGARDRIERVLSNGLEPNYSREKLAGAVRRIASALRFIDLAICGTCNGTGAVRGAWCTDCDCSGLVEATDR